MASYLDFNKEVDTREFDYRKYFYSLPEEDRKRIFAERQKLGLEAPTEDNVFVEAGQAAAQSFVSGMGGFGATVNELGGGSSIQDYFQGVLENNQQWNAPQNGGIATYFARSIGSAAGSTAGVLAAGTAGNLIGGPAGGLAAGITAGFSQTFGQNVQRNREAGYSEEKALGMAFLESSVNSAIENAPFGIVGKWSKALLLKKVGRSLAKEVGQKQAQNLLVKWGKQALMSGLGEAGEEGLQYINTYVNQRLGGDHDAEFSIDEFADSMAQGMIGGFFLGGVQSGIGIRQEARQEQAANIETTPVAEAPADRSSYLEQVIQDVGNEFGIKVDYLENYKGPEDVTDANGLYDKATKTIYIDRQHTNFDVAETLGHELKHYVDDTYPELAKSFDDLWEKGQTEQGSAFFKELLDTMKIPADVRKEEFGAEVFQRVFVRPDTWKSYAEVLDQQTPGMGEKFIKIIQQFIQAIKRSIEGIAPVDPEMETLFNNVQQMEKQAGNILAELRRRKGNSTEVENVVGVKGNTEVESVPVSQINVDAQRFQFKSNTSKLSGVDESNKLGGSWDARTAGNLYLWQDKNGKLYVINGHHRLELAQRKGVENVNAIIDRESDGVTAEQARRNGVLINIRDGQGDVRDYASFVRSEKLTAEEADSQGVTARKKGRAGFLLGKSGDMLYDAYRNDVIPESKAVIIAEVAQGNEAIEYAGIKLATDRKLAGEVLRQTLKLAVQNSSGTKTQSEQGGLFDTVDDSVLQEWEDIGKAAAKHIKEIRTRIEAAKDAIKNPEAAASLGVKTAKGAEKLLAQAQQDLARWENYATDAELMAQLREEAGIAPQEVVSETESTTATNEKTSAVEEVIQEPSVSKTEKTTDKNGQKPTETDNDVVSAKNAQTTDAKLKAVYGDFKDRSEEIGLTYDAFEKGFQRSLNSILAQARKSFGGTYGTTLEDQWSNAAQDAMVKAYMKYPADAKNSINTYASRAVVNAITDVNRKAQRQGTALSLDQTNEQGEALGDVVADEKPAQYSDEVSIKADPKEGMRRILQDAGLTPDEKKLVNIFVKAKSYSELAKGLRSLGPKFGENGKSYMTEAEMKLRLKAMADKVASVGVMKQRKRIWTGSAADYDKPSLQYIGTGEGAQVYGWGLYGSESRKVAEWYARSDAKRKHGDAPVVRHFGSGYSAEELYNNQGDSDFEVLVYVYELGGVQQAIDHLQKEVDSKKEYMDDDYIAEERILEQLLEEKDEIEYLGDSLAGKRNLYNQTFWPDKQEDLLDWDVAVPKEQRSKVLDALEEDIVKLEPGSDQFLYGRDVVEGIEGNSMYSGMMLYMDLSKALGSPKAASEFLYRAGIDGITYIGDSSGVRNYVAFSDKDIQVDEHIRFQRKRLHQQLNPVVRNGVVQEEYADLLANRKYTPQKIKEWQDKAYEWITKVGGVKPAVDALLNNKAPSEAAVAEMARRMILNSDVFAQDIDKEQRTKLYETEIDVRSEWGRAGRAMQLAALQMKDIASIQAVLNKLHKDMPPADVRKLRDQILKDVGVDIYNMDQKIVDDRPKLDAVLRAHLAKKSTFKDKFYEYWINSILSGPTTHFSNLLGNTANAVYELGIKRFTEALLNSAMGRKDGASFGEFKEMIRAFNWGNARKAMAKSWDIEVLDPSGKFLENHNVAIGGKTGRFIRVPGRALKAADAFAKALIEPMETAAYAYRMGVEAGLTGSRLQGYIQDQLTNKDSKAYAWAKERARELTFQEDPGAFISRLVALKETEGIVGDALKLFLPFVKTPANILKQGARKSPLGTLSLLNETIKLAAGNRKFDGEYVGRVAEQLIAWGAFMAVASLGDDDDTPFITGSSPQYGSAEYGFKANKIPPYSIRIGDAWYSYQRIEPLSTGLAVIADGIKAWRNARNGKDGTAVMKDLWNSSKQIIFEKSYIDSIGELYEATQNPENFVKAAVNPARGIIPNIYSQVRRSFDEEVQDSKSREVGIEWLKDQFFVVTNRAGVTTALPKVDYFGRDVKKDDWGDAFLSPLKRMLPVKKISADSNIDKAEQLILNYNYNNPNEEYYPSIPGHTISVNGKKMYLSGEDYHDYAVDAGKLAHKQIHNAINAGKLNVDNPAEQDIKLIKKIFSRAKKVTKEKYINKAKQL